MNERKGGVDRKNKLLFKEVIVDGNERKVVEAEGTKETLREVSDLGVFLPERQIASPEESLKMQISVTAIEDIRLVRKFLKKLEGMILSPSKKVILDRCLLVQ